MINLLPPDIKDSYRYGLRNVILRRWITAFVVAFIGLGLIISYGAITLQQSTDRYQKKLVNAEAQLKEQDFDGTKKQVTDISNSFKLVLQVLGKEVLFSELIKKIASTIPKDANLTGLTISQTQGGLDITAVAKDYTTATQVQVNLADPKSKLFTKADILTISCNDTTSSDPRYPCAVTIRALFAANNPYLFINNKATK